MGSRGRRVRIIRRPKVVAKVSRVDGRGRPRLDVAHAAAAGGEEDEVLGEDGGAVVPAAATAQSLPGADDATLDVLAEGHAREVGRQVSYRGADEGRRWCRLTHREGSWGANMTDISVVRDDGLRA